MRENAITEEEKTIIETLRSQWLEADEEYRVFLSCTQPIPYLNNIPEFAEWKEKRAKEAATTAGTERSGDEADEIDSGSGDFLSVNSSVELSSLPGEGDDDNDVQIVMNTQIGTSIRGAFDLMNLSEDEINDEDEDKLQAVNYGGFGYGRAPNHYSDDEEGDASIRVGGVQVAVPKSRRRR